VLINNGFESTDTLSLYIYDDNAGIPGTLLQTSVNSVSGTDLVWSSPNYYKEFDMSGGSNLTANTIYWMVLKRSGALDDNNNYLVRYQLSGTDAYTRGRMLYQHSNDSTWHNPGDFSDIYF